MALAYTAPTWEDGSGQGISASQLQALCNCVEGLVQGTDKAIHDVQINGTIITITYADGSIQTTTITNALKSIALISKTGTEGLVDTYTITFSDGTTSQFTVTNGIVGADGVGVTGVELHSTSGKIKTYRMSFSDGTFFDYEVKDGADGSGIGDMISADYDPNETVKDAGGIEAYVEDKLDEWTSEVTLASDNTFTFTGLNDSYGYKLFCDAPKAYPIDITQTGTTVVYTMGGSGLLVGTTKGKLRIIK